MRSSFFLLGLALALRPATAEENRPLFPPPDPVPAANAMSIRTPDASPVPLDKTTPDQIVPDDGGRPDAAKLPSIKAEPDVVEETPSCFQHVEQLRQSRDPFLAIDYLKDIAANANNRPQYRSRAIIELCDLLDSQDRLAEELCWLKVWGQMFPARREVAGICFRMAVLYTRMGLPDLARDAYYLCLSQALKQGDMQGSDDLRHFHRLTTATLWGLAANEYQTGDWARAVELFARYRHEATAATPASLEKAAFLQADCYYQLKASKDAVPLYEETLKAHPFNPLVPQARLRLYHLYVLNRQPDKAQAEMAALIWTVRTVWSKDELYWQRQTAQFLLAINHGNTEVLPPLVRESAQLPAQGKTWQEALNHYDALVSYEMVKTRPLTETSTSALARIGDEKSREEAQDLFALNDRLNHDLPPPPNRRPSPSPL